MSTYTPNHISTARRVGYTVSSAALLAYGSYGVWVNDLYLPGRRGPGAHLHDASAWLMYGTILSACVVLLSVVVDHYDRRNNEERYRAISDVFTGLGFWLAFLSLAVHFARQA